MPLTIEQILTQVARREIGVDAACTQLEALAAASPDPVTRLIARVQTEIAVGRLAHDAGRKLIAALERAGDRTVMLGSQTKIHADATIIRSAGAQPQADSDMTIRKAVVDNDATVVQQKPVAPASPAEITQLRPLMSEPTVRTAPVGSETVIREFPQEPGGEATQRGSRANETVRHEQDVTLRGVKPDHDVTMRTLVENREATVRAPKQHDATIRGALPDADATSRTLKQDVDATVHTLKHDVTPRAYAQARRGRHRTYVQARRGDAREHACI